MSLRKSIVDRKKVAQFYLSLSQAMGREFAGNPQAMEKLSVQSCWFS